MTIMTTVTEAVPTKLPLWRTIGQAYAVWVRNFPELVRICWPWMLLMTPIIGVWMWWQQPHILQEMQAAGSGEPFADPNPLLSVATQIGDEVIMLPALASMAVAWHRLLLRDEHPGPGLYLRFDRIVAGYAILAFCIGLITLAPNLILTINSNALGFVAGIALLVGSFIVARLSLALPGIALGRDDVTLGTVWRASKRNTWRMVWAYLFCVLPGIAINGGIIYWTSLADHGPAVVTLVWLVMGLLWIPIGMISVGMLSIAYRHFFERNA
jgi:hypothetical protein